MESFQSRLNTFSHPHWRTKNRAKFNTRPESLASAGFYAVYTEHDDPNPDEVDVVQCWCCNKTLGGWEKDDSAWEEHKSHSKQCCMVGVANGHHESILATYNNASWNSLKKKDRPTALQLAKAGFFHSPNSDCIDTTQCFQCGLALGGWEAGDDPRHEHEKRKKKCPFLLTGKAVKPTFADFYFSNQEYVEPEEIKSVTMKRASREKLSKPASVDTDSSIKLLKVQYDLAVKNARDLAKDAIEQIKLM